jgi:hypothetical protein
MKTKSSLAIERSQTALPEWLRHLCAGKLCSVGRPRLRVRAPSRCVFLERAAGRRCNPYRVVIPINLSPKVARAAQPWAECHHPVGVMRLATAESEKAVLQNAVTATDQQIDALVYELYNLTSEEIKLVEDTK